MMTRSTVEFAANLRPVASDVKATNSQHGKKDSLGRPSNKKPRNEIIDAPPATYKVHTNILMDTFALSMKVLKAVLRNPKPKHEL